MDLGSAVLGFLTAFVAKGLVMFLGAWLIYRIAHTLRYNDWLLVGQNNRHTLKIMLLALSVFYVGEVACAVDTVLKISAKPMEIFDWIHSVCAGIGSALVALGLYKTINGSLVFYGEKKCLMRRVCHTCTIDHYCNFNRVISLLAFFLLLTAILPFFVSTAQVDLDPMRSALPVDSWNAWYDETMVPLFYQYVPEYEPGGQAYYIPESVFLMEFRILAGLAFLGAFSGLYLALTRRPALAVKTMALCAGLLGYIYFEIALYRGIHDALLSSFGHEVTEVWFLIFLKIYLEKMYGIPNVKR